MVSRRYSGAESCNGDKVSYIVLEEMLKNVEFVMKVLKEAVVQI